MEGTKQIFAIIIALFKYCYNYNNIIFHDTGFNSGLMHKNVKYGGCHVLWESNNKNLKKKSTSMLERATINLAVHFVIVHQIINNFKNSFAIRIL